MEKKSKKAYKARTIVFTSYKYGDDPEAYLRFVHTKCDWVLGQLEKCPETGRIHIQGMAWSKDNKSWGFMSPNHWEKCLCPAKSVEYCSKEKSRLDGPWEFGIRPTWNVAGAKKDRVTNAELLSKPITQLVDEERVSLRGVKKLNEDINFYRMMKGGEPIPQEDNLWIYGPPGSGKSYMVRQMSDSLYTKPQNKWFDNYQGEKDMLIDDFDHMGKGLSHYLKIWADRYPFTAEIKGGSITPRLRRVFVTSNYTPREIWGDESGGSSALVDAIERRFTIKYLSARGAELVDAADL